MFDQGVFQKEGIMLIIGDGPFHGIDQGNQPGRLPVVVYFYEVGSNAFTEILGLAHIQDLFITPVIFIYSGSMWQGRGYIFLEILFSHAANNTKTKIR